MVLRITYCTFSSPHSPFGRPRCLKLRRLCHLPYPQRPAGAAAITPETCLPQRLPLLALQPGLPVSFPFSCSSCPYPSFFLSLHILILPSFPTKSAFPLPHFFGMRHFPLSLAFLCVPSSVSSSPCLTLLPSPPRSNEPASRATKHSCAAVLQREHSDTLPAQASRPSPSSHFPPPFFSSPALWTFPPLPSPSFCFSFLTPFSPLPLSPHFSRLLFLSPSLCSPLPRSLSPQHRPFIANAL